MRVGSVNPLKNMFKQKRAAGEISSKSLSFTATPNLQALRLQSQDFQATTSGVEYLTARGTCTGIPFDLDDDCGSEITELMASTQNEFETCKKLRDVFGEEGKEEFSFRGEVCFKRKVDGMGEGDLVGKVRAL